MICPHCKRSQLYKQRGGRRCGECRKEFAFEPKGHPLALHDARFRKAIVKLGGGADVRYTAEQLRHLLARKPVAAQKPPSPGAITVAGLVAAVVAGLVAKSITGSTVLGIVAVAAVAATTLAVARVMASRPFYRTLPLDAARFRIDVLDRWRKIYGEFPPGLVDVNVLHDRPEAAFPIDNLAAVVVCSEREVLACLLANDIPRRMRVGLLPAAPPFEARQQKVLDVLRANPKLPIFVLHDASAKGIFLARDLRRTLRLTPAHRVYDLGLNPRRSIQKKRLTLGAPVSEDLKARLRGELAHPDPARPIRRKRAVVAPDEVAWLEAGNYSPILAITPKSLIKRIAFALEKLASKRREKAAQRHDPAARAVGFLTWPE